MKHALLAAALLLMVAPAWAATKPAAVEVEKLPPVGEVQAQEETAEDDRPATPEEQALLLCQTAQIMGENISADYVPGVDAYGRPVASADVGNAPVYTLPERIDIPLNIAVLRDTGIITTPTPDLSTNVGQVSVLKGGQVLFNGQDLTSSIQTFCNANMNKPNGTAQ